MAGAPRILNRISGILRSLPEAGPRARVSHMRTSLLKRGSLQSTNLCLNMSTTHVEVANKHLVESLKTQDVNEYYDQWGDSGGYDEDMTEDVFLGPKYASDAVIRLLGDNSQQRIMDIGAGTGKVAIYLKNHNIVNIDALEPSSGMLKKAEGLYKKTYVEFVSENTIPDGIYDCVVTAGCFLPGYMPPDSLKQLANITKPGGRVVISLRSSVLDSMGEYSQQLCAELEKMKSSWVEVERTEHPNYYLNNPGTVLVFVVNQ